MLLFMWQQHDLCYFYEGLSLYAGFLFIFSFSILSFIVFLVLYNFNSNFYFIDAAGLNANKLLMITDLGLKDVVPNSNGKV